MFGLVRSQALPACKGLFAVVDCSLTELSTRKGVRS